MLLPIIRDNLTSSFSIWMPFCFLAGLEHRVDLNPGIIETGLLLGRLDPQRLT